MLFLVGLNGSWVFRLKTMATRSRACDNHYGVDCLERAPLCWAADLEQLQQSRFVVKILIFTRITEQKT